MKTTPLATAVGEKKPRRDKTVEVVPPHPGSLETKTEGITDEDGGPRGKPPSEEKDPWLPRRAPPESTTRRPGRRGHQLLHQQVRNLPAFPASHSSDSAACRSERIMTRSAWARVPILRTTPCWGGGGAHRGNVLLPFWDR